MTARIKTLPHKVLPIGIILLAACILAPVPAQALVVSSYATTFVTNAGWSNQAGLLGQEDGDLSEGGAENVLQVGGWQFSDLGLIQRVTIEVLAKLEDDPGIPPFIPPFREVLTHDRGASPSQYPFRSIVLDWASKNITADLDEWTWAKVNQMKVRLEPELGAGNFFGKKVWVDAFRVTVQYQPPTPTPTPTFTNTPQPTITPSPTRTGTFTPTPSYTITPTPSMTQTSTPANNPRIRLAGYFGTDVTSQEGGPFQLIAWADSPLGDQIREVKLYFNGAPTDVVLPPINRAAGVFGLPVQVIGAGVFPDIYLLELRAEDIRGAVSTLWPYLYIKTSAVSAPMPEPRVEHWEALAAQVLSPGQAARRAGNFDTPRILAAGWNTTQLSVADGGDFSFLAAVTDPNGLANVQSVELYYHEVPTGILLVDDGNNGDFASGDGIFGLQVTFLPGAIPQSMAGTHLFQLVATDFEGNRSLMWPYFTVLP